MRLGSSFMMSSKGQNWKPRNGGKSPATPSDEPDVFCARPLISMPFGEGHLLSFPELVEAHTFQIFGMEKDVLIAPGVDKSEASVRESFDGAFCHFSHSLRSVQ